MSQELLDLCHKVIDHAGGAEHEIGAAKQAVTALHEEGGLAKAAQELAHDHIGELAVKVLTGMGIPFLAAELISAAAEKILDDKKDAT